MKELQMEDKFCLTCGKQFNSRRFGHRLEDATRFSKRKYCSKHCARISENPSDRTTYHKRAQAFRKSECEIYGTGNLHQCHHKDGNIANNTADNIQTLCATCHMKLHWSAWKNGKRNNEKTALR